MTKSPGKKRKSATKKKRVARKASRLKKKEGPAKAPRAKKKKKAVRKTPSPLKWRVATASLEVAVASNAIDDGGVTREEIDYMKDAIGDLRAVAPNATQAAVYANLEWYLLQLLSDIDNGTINGRAAAINALTAKFNASTKTLKQIHEDAQANAQALQNAAQAIAAIGKLLASAGAAGG
jgi:hypothetical protein